MIVNTGLGLSLDRRLCGDNHPLITVIYLLVGQDYGCSAGNVDLGDKETKGKREDNDQRLMTSLISESSTSLVCSVFKLALMEEEQV